MKDSASKYFYVAGQTLNWLCLLSHLYACQSLTHGLYALLCLFLHSLSLRWLTLKYICCPCLAQAYQCACVCISPDGTLVTMYHSSRIAYLGHFADALYLLSYLLISLPDQWSCKKFLPSFDVHRPIHCLSSFYFILDILNLVHIIMLFNF